MSHIHATLFITFFLAFSVIVNYVFHKLLTLSGIIIGKSAIIDMFR